MDTKRNFGVYSWYLIVSIATSILAIAIPLDLVLDLLHIADIQLLVSSTIALLFFFDMAQSYYRYKFGQRELGLWEIKGVKHYLRKWLPIDFIAMLPVGIITGIPALGLIRLVKIFKVMHYMYLVRHNKVRLSRALDISFFLFWIAHSTHWIACIWLYLRPPLPGTDPGFAYIKALYWSVTTLTTIGYGDIVPTTGTEMLFTIFVMLLGVALYGYVIANIASTVFSTDPATTQYRSNLEKLSTLMKYRKLPRELEQKIRNYYFYQYKSRQGFSEANFLRNLPERLNKEVSVLLKQEVVEKIPIFKESGSQFIRDIAQYLVFTVAMPGDIIFEKGDIAEQLYFVVKGELLVLHPNSTEPLATLQTGDFFGEIALFNHNPRSASIRATKITELYSLHKTHFDRVMQHYPKIAEVIIRKGEARMAENKASAVKD